MELRKLKSEDIFPLCGIIKNIGYREFKECLSSPELRDMMSKKGDVNASQIGMTFLFDVGGVIIGNLPKCEKQIYSWLASLTGESEKALRDMDMGDFMELVIAIFKKEEFRDFFQRASKFLK